MIALFNAIAQSKRESAEEVETSSLSKQKAQQADNVNDIKEMTQSNLIDLLTNKSGRGDKKITVSDTEMMSNGKGAKHDTSDGDKNKDDHKSSTWSVLNDDYMMNKSNSLRKWDNALESSSGEEENEMGIDDGGDDDL